MKTTPLFLRQIVNNLFISCLFCLTLLFWSGCGSKSSKLNEMEEAEVKKYVDVHGRDAIVQFLGAELFKVVPGWTPMLEVKTLSDVDEQRILKYLKYFVSKGADINAKWTNDDETPLHLAVATGNVKIAKFLVSNGVDVKAKTTGPLPTVDFRFEPGSTALDMAKLRKDTAMIEYLSSIK